MQRVVVEQDQLFGLHPLPELQCVRDRRMTPAQVVGVLGIRVLAVVDQRRGSASEAEAGDPVVLELRERSAQAGLVIGDVAQGRVSVVYPVAERRATVVD